MINRRKKIISFVKKYKNLYLFLKFIESVFQALRYYLSKIIAHLFHNQIINFSSKQLQEKFFHFEISPKTFFEYVVCFSVVKKVENMSYQEQEKLRIDSWRGKSGLTWHNETDSNEYQDMYFDEQSKGLISELNKISENFKNKKVCFIDVSTGNGKFLNFFCDKLNFNLTKVGIDINREIIEQNIQKKPLKDLKFLHGTVKSNFKYLNELSENYSLIFFARKSLTFFTYNDLIDLMETINELKNVHYFVIIEMDDTNLYKETKSRLRDHPAYYSHHYLKIFKEFDWEPMYVKQKYMNWFINDYRLDVIFSKQHSQ